MTVMTLFYGEDEEIVHFASRSSRYIQSMYGSWSFADSKKHKCTNYASEMIRLKMSTA